MCVCKCICVCVHVCFRERDALKLEVENLSTAMTQIGRSESSIKNELEKVTREVSLLKLVHLLG